MWTSLYSESVATAKNLRALDFAQEKIKNIAPYIHFPNPKSSIEGEMTRGLEQKTRIGTFYPYERESVAFYLNHLRVPSSRYVRLVRRFHDEWKSDGQCAPIVLQVSLPAAFYQSASGFTRWPLPALFSCRWFMPARVRHARHDAFLFPFRDAAQTRLSFRWFAPPKWFNIRETSPRRGAAPSSSKLYYSSLLLLPMKERRSMEGDLFHFFFFLLPFLVSILLCPNIELLIPNIEQRYARKRKTEIAITACLIFDES